MVWRGTSCVPYGKQHCTAPKSSSAEPSRSMPVAGSRSISAATRRGSRPVTKREVVIG